MPTMVNGVMRFDINDPKDLLALIQSGLVWRGGPDSIDAAVEYLRQHPEAVNDKVPPAVLASLQSPGQSEGNAAPPAPATPEPESPAEDQTEPAEEPSAPPAP